MEQIYFCTTKIEPRHMLFDKVKREQQVWWGMKHIRKMQRIARNA